MNKEKFQLVRNSLFLEAKLAHRLRIDVLEAIARDDLRDGDTPICIHNLRPVTTQFRMRHTAEVALDIMRLGK